MRTDGLTKEQEDLKKQLYELVNEWMKLKPCQDDPELALGMALGAFSEAAANYTATYRFHNRLSAEWSDICCNAAAKIFQNSHYIHLDILAKTMGTEDHPTINLAKVENLKEIHYGNHKRYS